MLDSVVNTYLLAKFWWGRGSSHTELPLNMVSKIALFSLILDKYQIPLWGLIVVGAVIILAILGIGYVDDVHGVASKETSIVNLRNKEIQTLLSRKVK